MLANHSGQRVFQIQPRHHKPNLIQSTTSRVAVMYDLNKQSQ